MSAALVLGFTIFAVGFSAGFVAGAMWASKGAVMNWRNLFRREPTPAQAAAVLSRHAQRVRREAIRAKARAMREALGLPPVEALR